MSAPDAEQAAPGDAPEPGLPTASSGLEPDLTPATSDADAELAERFARELAESQRRADEHWNLYLRAQADMENLRRRSEQLRREALDRQKRDLLGTVLEVSDTVDRALAMSAQADAQTLRAGIASMHREIERVLTREGVARIAAQDAPFDPELHEAVGAVEMPGLAAEKVIAVERAGYTLGGELFRPARVMVGQPPG